MDDPFDTGSLSHHQERARDLHGYGDWEWPQATTRFGGRDVFLSAARHRQGEDYARLGSVTLPSRWNATLLLLAFRCAKFSTLKAHQTNAYQITEYLPGELSQRLLSAAESLRIQLQAWDVDKTVHVGFEILGPPSWRC